LHGRRGNSNSADFGKGNGQHLTSKIIGPVSTFAGLPGLHARILKPGIRYLSNGAAALPRGRAIPTAWSKAHTPLPTALPQTKNAGMLNLILTAEHESIYFMTATVAKLTDEVQALPEKELDEFLSWLADYELAHPGRWDREIEHDSQPGGRLQAVLTRVRRDISAGRTRPIDEVINNS